MEAALRFNAERGDYGPGDVDEQVRERLDLARKFEAHQFERERPDGTVVEIRGRPVTGGGFVTVTTYTDITDRKRAEQELARQTNLLNDVLETIGQGIGAFDGEQRVIATNGRYQEFLGLPDHLVEVGASGHDIAVYLAAQGASGDGTEDPAAVAERRMEMLAGDEPTSTELAFPGGDVYHALTQPRADGGYVITYTDITERKRAEQELARQTNLLNDVLETVGQGIGAFDRDLRLVATNSRFQEFLALPDHLVEVGASGRDIAVNIAERGGYGDSDPAATAAARNAEQTSGRSTSREILGVTGNVYHALTQPRADGGFVVTYTDITERKQAEEEIRHARDAAEAATKAKANFLASMSH